MADLQGVKNLIGPHGRPAVGTIEIIFGKALLNEVSPGDTAADYFGETEVWWDVQRSVRGPNGGVMLIDEDANEWEAEFLEKADAYRPNDEPHHLAAILARTRGLATSLRDFLRMFPDYDGPAFEIARHHLAAAEAIVGLTLPTPTRVIREMSGDVRDEHEADRVRPKQVLRPGGRR